MHPSLNTSIVAPGFVPLVPNLLRPLPIDHALSHTTVQHATLVQVEAVLNVSAPRVAQLERCQALAAPERASVDRVRGPVIHSVNLDDDAPGERTGNGKTYYKLVLQDHTGQQAYGMEWDKLPFLNGQKLPPIPVGSKLLIKPGTVVAHGVLMLRPDNVQFLGGSVPGLWLPAAEAARLAAELAHLQK